MPAIPLLLVQGKGVSDHALAALLQSPRVQILRVPDLHASPAAFARKSARVTLLATLGDPMREVVYARTSGFIGPLIVATDSDDVQLRDDVLDAGALACLELPIHQTQLDRALDLVEQQPAPPLSHPGLGLFLDPIDHTARHGARVVHLTARELALLHCLIGSSGRPVAIHEIYDYVWGGAKGGRAMYEVVHVNVSQLRKKLAKIGLRKAILTVRNFGYGLSQAGD